MLTSAEYTAEFMASLPGAADRAHFAVGYARSAIKGVLTNHGGLPPEHGGLPPEVDRRLRDALAILDRV